jgi:hypothetical protein
MAEVSPHEYDDERARRVNTESNREASVEKDSRPDQDSATTYPASLLSDKNLEGRGNGPVREVLASSTGQVAGHRSLQRALQRFSSGSGGARSDAGSHTPGQVHVQRFAEREHRSLGDEATGHALVNVGGEKGDARFELTHGEVVALTGDHFLATKEDYPPGMPYNNDDLFTLAAKPGKNGTAVGTRDEIIYVLYDMDSTNAGFLPGGIWEAHAAAFAEIDKGTARGEAAKAVKAATDERYERLAAVNDAHFAAPRGRDAAGKPLPSPEGTAGGSYRAMHERAIKLAHQAGATKGDISHAMAMEAAAQHYLTDAFSAGHVRTERTNIREYWHNMYPLFWYNLIHKIALDTAIQVNEQTTNLSTIWATVKEIYEEILGTAEKMAATHPPITMGDLIGNIFHDYDNEAGLTIEGGGMVYGDSNMDNPNPANVTRSRAVSAIRAGNVDITTAYDMGKEGLMPMFDQGLFDEVQARTSAPKGQYVAETMIPKPAADNLAQNWKAYSIEILWGLPVVGNPDARKSPTVGELFAASLQPGGELGDLITSVADAFPSVDEHLSGDVYPRQGYIDGFMKPLMADPYNGLMSIVHWAPNYGLRSRDTDDVSLVTGEELEKSGRLKGMTTPARAKYIKELAGGSVSEREEELIVRIFETAPPDERRNIYEQVEGHWWRRDWQHGLFESDDIWDALSRARLDHLKDLLNDSP